MIYFLTLTTYTLVLFARKKDLTPAEKWLLWLAPVTLFSEITSLILAHRYRNNLPLFHIYTVVELFFYGNFFNEAVPTLKKYHIGKFIAGTGTLLAILNVSLWQPINTINSIVLSFESFFICVCCLVAFSDLLRSEQPDPLQSRLFWITGAMLSYHAFTFFYWTFYPLFSKYLPKYMTSQIVPAALLWVNLFFYASLSVIFARRKRLILLRKAGQDY